MTGLSISPQSQKEQIRIQSLAFFLAIGICMMLSAFYALLYMHTTANHAKMVLDDKVNPNEDSMISISRLPSLGQSKAKAIVEYRQDGHVFENADDLDKVKGIGPKTVENVRPYLKFD